MWQLTYGGAPRAELFATGIAQLDRLQILHIVNLDARNVRRLHDRRGGERRPRRMRMHDVAVRAGRQPAVDDHLVPIQVEPLALREWVRRLPGAASAGSVADRLRAVVAHRAPTDLLILGRGGILPVDEARRGIRTSDREILERMRRDERTVHAGRHALERARSARVVRQPSANA